MPTKATKSKSPEVKSKVIVKDKVKTAAKVSPVKAVGQDKLKSMGKGNGKGKAKVSIPQPAPVSPVEEEEQEQEQEVVELDENVPVSSDQENGSDSEEEEEDDDDGIDEEGMKRLLKALGDDGLDDFDRAQILKLNGLDDDESGEEVSDEGAVANNSEAEDEDEEDSAPVNELGSESAAEDQDIPLDEADISVDEDAIPTRKVEIDNRVALERIRDTIALDPSLPWTEVLAVTYPHTIDVDVDDDLNREVAFYKQALYCANEARSLAAKHKLPFTRPSDYFAEMVKSDSHMERIRQRLLNETAAIKTREDKRKQREGKKYGKQVQVEKLKEREKSKKDMEEKIKGLKRKRKDMLTTDGDDFDVAVEKAISDKPSSGPNKRPKISRDARDKKYGFGKGADRRSKQNTRESTDNFGGARKGKGKRPAAGGKKKSQRPGKSKRMNSRSR